MNDVIFAFLFFLPAGFANMAPVLVNKIPIINRYNYPLDGYAKFRGKRILGDHKTWRGLLSGVVMGILIAWFEIVIFKFKISDGHDLNQLWCGGLMGLGALTGDSVKSFFKRQININSGQSWFIFDQIDYILGGIIFTLPVVILSWYLYFTILTIYFSLHLIISFLGYLLKFKASPL